jgi:AsmA-like protein
VTSRKKRILIWAAAAAGIVGATIVVVASLMLRPAYLKRQLVASLSEHLNLDVNVGDISLQFVPRLSVSGTDLTLRLPNRPDLPPFISIAHFHVNVGLLSAMRKHVDTVHVGGLKIAVPPKEALNSLPPAAPSDDEEPTKVIVDHLVAHDAELMFVPRQKGRPALTFRIYDLEVTDLGFDRAMPFYAKLTNPVPTGLVETRGSVGPWVRDNPTNLPISGDYTFTDADLSTINGIGGRLSSIGNYEGHLTEISVSGTTETPDFSLDLGGKPLPLKTKFEAVVDGTSGSTQLVSVDARIRNTAIKTRGTITNLAGPGRHDINLQVTIPNGRIEDILALAIDAPKPLLMGDLSLDSSFRLPPGKGRVPSRLTMAGRFGLGGARFTDQQVQEKLQELSRRSQGKDKDDVIGRVLTDLRGTFTIRQGLLTLPDLTFLVPGASVGLDGTYTLETGAIDFTGNLRMQSSVSRAVGGFKSIFLKPFDPLFRKNGAGAVVPIRITGTREAPKMSMQIGRVFGLGKG